MDLYDLYGIKGVTGRALAVADQAMEDGLPPGQALDRALAAAEAAGTGGMFSFLTRSLIKNRVQRSIEIKQEIKRAIQKGGISEMNKEIESLLKQILELDDLSGTRLQKLENCKYLIILDMGCGSTSAAILDLEHLKRGESLRNCISAVQWKYRDIRSTGKGVQIVERISIPTLIGYSNFNPVVGPVALKTGNACENFKKMPTKGNLRSPMLTITGPGISEPRTLANIWPDYFRCIADSICSWCAAEKSIVGPTNRLNMAEDTLVMVAHPAGDEWSESSVLKNYRDLIAEGTGLPDENILTISEAKAAMQYVRRKYERRLDFEKGVVIIDIGASTIDIEYLAKGLKAPREESLSMAGRDVDKLLLHYGLEKLYPAEMKKYTQPNQLPDESFYIDNFSCKPAIMKYDARMAKEMVSDLARSEGLRNKPCLYVIGTEENKSINITADTLEGLLGDEKNDPLTGAIFGKRSFPAAYPAYIAEYIRKVKGLQPDAFSTQQVEDTWYGHLENIVRYVMDTLAGEGRRVGQVIVTGGSCRLPGIPEHIWKAIQVSEMGSVFSDPRNIIPMDGENDYENAVPFGGGYYVGGALAKLDTLQKFPEKLYACLYEELDSVATNEIADAVNSLVRHITLDSLKWWKNLSNGNANCSTNKLNAHIKSECTRVFNRTSQLDDAVATAIGKLTLAASLPKTMGEINTLLDTLAGTKFSGQVKPDIKLNLPVNNVTNAVRRVNPDTLTLGIWASITAAVQNAINGVMNFFRSIFDYEEVEENDLLRGSSYREAVYESYKSDVNSAVEPQLKRDISDQLRQEFRKTNIFGIPGQTIGVLRQDIIHALYLN